MCMLALDNSLIGKKPTENGLVQLGPLQSNGADQSSLRDVMCNIVRQEEGCEQAAGDAASPDAQVWRRRWRQQRGPGVLHSRGAR